ncbi:callose synthase 1 [Tanacetum coccineum]
MVLAPFIYLYAQLFLELSGADKQLSGHNTIHKILTSHAVYQYSCLLAFSMIAKAIMNHGVASAITNLARMPVCGAAVFFMIGLGSKAHFFERTLLHDSAHYRAIGRDFALYRVLFSDLYKIYFRSHFMKGGELLLLLIVM